MSKEMLDEARTSSFWTKDARRDTMKQSSAQATLAALHDDRIGALILSEAGQERPAALDAGRLANRICDAAGIGSGHEQRPAAYPLALGRLARVAESLPGARYVKGLT